MMVIVALLVGLCVSSPVEIPFVFDGRGHPIFQTRIRQIFGDDLLPARLTIKSMSFVFVEPGSNSSVHHASVGPRSDVRMLIGPSVHFTVSLMHVSELAAARMRDLRADRIEYSIGPMDLFGSSSLDFIRSGTIRLNASADSFIANFCDSTNQIVQLNFDSSNSQERFFVIPAAIGFDRDSMLTFNVTVRMQGTTDHLIHLPLAMYNHIMTLTNARPDRLFRPPSIENCSTELLEELPSIDLRFFSSAGTNVSLVRLYPEDYIRATGNNTCELLVEANTVTDTMVFDPLMLSNVNVRFEQNTLYFCDTTNTD